MKQAIMRKLFVLVMAVAMLASYSLPSASMLIPGGEQAGAEMAYADSTIADEDWSFDAETGELKGFADGSNYDNPTDLVIPAEIGGVPVKSIGNQAFQYASSGSGKKIKNALTSLTLPEGLESIGRQSFQSSARSTTATKIVIPASVKTLDYRAFYGWDSVKEVEFSENSQIETIGEAAFYSCYALENVALPNGLKTIAVDAFRDTSLKKIDIPESVETIGATAFALTLIKEFTLPDNVTSWSKTKTGADPTGTSVMFYRTAQDKTVSSSGYYSQGTLELTRVFDKTGQATPSNTGAVVNPQPVTVNFIDQDGDVIKAPEEAVGAEYNALRGVEGTYSTKYYLDEGAGDGHLYFDYLTPFQDTGKTDVYSNKVSGDENKDWAAALIGGNYFTAGKEYTFKAPKISGYTEPTETITKTITADDHEITFVYQGAEKVDLTAVGDGLTLDPAAGKVGVGSDVTATIEVPEGKKIDTFTVNDVDHKADLTKADGKYTYKFELTEATEVKVTYVDLSKANITVTVSNKGDIASDNSGKAMANRPVEVTDIDGDEKFTVDEALVAAHKAYNSTDGYDPGSGFVSKLWGVSSTNNLFFINGQGIPNGVLEDAVEEGDHLLASINKDASYYSDWVSRFDESSAELITNEQRVVTLVGHSGMAYDEEGKKDVPLAGIQLGTWNDGVFTPIVGAITDAEGKATVAFDEEGEYVLTAQGTVLGTATDWNMMQLGQNVYGRMDNTTYDMEVAYTDADYGDGPYPADEIKWIDYDDDWEDLNYLHNNQVQVNSPLIAPAMTLSVEAPKAVLTGEGEGLTLDPEAGRVTIGTKVTASIEVPEGKSIDTFTVNNEDHKGDLSYSEGKHTYKFDFTEDTTVKVTYKDQSSADVYITVSNKGNIASDNDGKAMVNRKVSVLDNDGNDKLTYDEALAAAHKTYNSADGYDPGSGFVRKLWGVSSTNTLFFINGQGIPNSVIVDTVSEGDRLTASINKDDQYYSDWYSKFDKDSMDVFTGREKEVTLVGHSGMAYTEEGRKDVPIEGAQLGIWKDGSFQPIVGAITDIEGKAKVSFDEAGEYILTAQGEQESVATDWNLISMSVGTDGPYGRMDGTTYATEIAYTDIDYGNGPYPADEIKYIDFFEEADEDSDNDYAWQDLNYLKSNQVITGSPLIAPAMTVTVEDPLTLLSAMRVGATPGYQITPEFDGTPGDYTFEMPESIVTLAAAPTKSADGNGATIKAIYTNANTGAETTTNITGTFANLSNFRKYNSPSGSTFRLEVTKGEQTDVFTFTNKVISHMNGLSVSENGNKVKFSPAFNTNTFEYTAEVLDTVDKIEIATTPYTSSSNSPEYEFTIAGEQAEEGKAEVELTGETTEIPIVVQGEGFEPTTYTLTVNRVPAVKLSFDTIPEGAYAYVTDKNGDRIYEEEDGSFIVAANQDNKYVITKPGYVAETGTANIAEDTTIEVTLEEAAENTDIDPSITSEFPDFRGNASTNMAIVDIKTPISAAGTQLNWANREGGYSWPQILVGDYVVTASGTTLRMINKETGETEKTATMAGPQGYTNVPMTYKDGVIYCPLDNGIMQAFDAASLKSLYVLRDPRGGQAQSSVYIDGDYGYVGFMNNGGGDVHYLAFTLTDEDPEDETEVKQPTWTHTQAGGFYWAMPMFAGDYLLIGTEDGTSASNNPANVLAMDKLTGKVVDKLPVTGDVRSAISYSNETGRYYTQTAAGDLISFKFDPEEGKFSDKKSVNLGASLAKCTPVVYKGVIYTGAGNFNAGQMIAVDEETMEEIWRIDLKGKGQTQGSFILSTAYEEDTGYIYLYATYNGLPGGVDMVKVKPDEKDAANVFNETIYDAEGYAQYCNCSLIVDSKGNMYYKNDTGNVFSIGPVLASLDSLTAEGGNPEWDKEFESKRNDYNITVDPGTTSVQFDFVPTEGNIVEIDGKIVEDTTYTAKVRNGEGRFEVTARSGENSKTYTVNIRERSQDATLATLLVNESNSYGGAKAMTPAFDPEGKEFIVYNVGSSRSFENVWPDTTDPNATYKVFPVSGVRTTGSDIDPTTGEIKRTATSGTHGRYAVYFASGERTMKVRIEVTSESGDTTKEYFVTMTKDSTPNRDDAQEFCDSIDPTDYSGEEKEAVKAAKEALQEAIDNGTDTDVKNALADAMKAVNENKTTQEKLDDLNKALDKAKTDLEAAKQDVQDAENAAKDAMDSAEDAKQAAEDAVKKAEEDLEAAKQAIEEELEAAKKAIEDAQKAAEEEQAKKMAELEKAIEDAKKAAEDARKASEEEQAKKIAELEKAIENAKKEAEEASKSADTAKKEAEEAKEEVDESLDVQVSSIKTGAKMKKKTMAIKWKKVPDATNYKIAYRQAGKKWIEKSTNGKNTYTLKKLKKNGLYEFKLKAEKVSGSIKTVSKWSEVNYRFFANTKSKLTPKKKAIIAKAKKVKKGSGYDVQYSLKKNMSGAKIKSFKGAKKTKLKVSGLKAKTKYFARVRPYKNYKGHKYIGIWNGAKKAKTK